MVEIFLKTLPFFALIGIGYWAGWKQFFTKELFIWMYIGSVILTGFFSWWYKDFAKSTLIGWRLFRLPEENLKSKIELRKSIMYQINSLLK